MIGRRRLPDEYVAFNSRWGAPLGRRDLPHLAAFTACGLLHLRVLQARSVGPFGFQPGNNATRAFEYPWAATVVDVGPQHTVVDVGGSCGGLQFVLGSMGARVINVDPSTSATMGWAVNEDTISLLNRAFGTRVELRKTFLQDAGIPSSTVDRLYCISTIEHIPEDQIPSLMSAVHDVLVPGGFAVLTIDLFYDLFPFTATRSNQHGTNIDVRRLVESSGLELHVGDRNELNGYPEFDPLSILGRAQEFVQGNVAVNTAQALVLKKPT